MEYRNCIAEDLHECAELLKLVYALPPYNEEWELPHAEAYLSRIFGFDPALCFVACEADKIIGVIFAYSYPWQGNECCYIQEIFVSPSHHRKGVGKGLMQQLSGTKGVGPTWLVAHESAKAIQFYESLGFSSSGPHKFYVGAV